MTVQSFSRQNDTGLGALTVVLWENLELVVVPVLESRALSPPPLPTRRNSVARESKSLS